MLILDQLSKFMPNLHCFKNIVRTKSKHRTQPNWIFVKKTENLFLCFQTGAGDTLSQFYFCKGTGPKIYFLEAFEKEEKQVFHALRVVRILKKMKKHQS